MILSGIFVASTVRALLVITSLALLVGCSSFQSNGSGSAVRPDESALAAYTKLGMQYLQAGDLLSAKDTLQKAVSADAKYAPALNGLALVFQAEQERDLADGYYKQAIAADPSSAMIHNNYGAFLYSLGRYEEACTQLQSATEDPFYTQRAQAFENLGRCYRLIGRVDAAEFVLKRAITLSPDRASAQIELADLYIEKGDQVAANQRFVEFKSLLEQGKAQHFAKSLWVGVRLSRLAGSPSKAATYALLLKNLYPNSEEYKNYKESGL